MAAVLVHLLNLVYWLVSAESAPSNSSFMRTLAGCPGKCGNVRVPYPFGIGPNCSLPGFDFHCNTSTDQLLLLTSESDAYRVVNISKSQIRIKNPVYASRCEDARYAPTNMTIMDFTGSPYTLSKANSFTQVGCTDLTVLEGSDSGRNKFLRGCVTFCSTNNFSVANSSCPGNACCQIQVPRGTVLLNVSVSALDNNWASGQDARCSYSFLGERDDSTSHAVSQLYKQGTARYAWMKNRTVVLDWRIGTAPCTPDAACLNNSRCVNATAGIGGYRCSCSPGYEGNPYLPPGCQGSSHILFSFYHLLPTSFSIISFYTYIHL